ncbi:MAG: antitoxin family protein [Bryobacterales bacterium]|nr:antitoxin family protein [Bryobacterales bacterium]
MQRTFQAIYEDGLLRPLEALDLRNPQHVQVTIAEVLEPDDAAGYFEPEEWEASKTGGISLEDVRRALSSIPGSLADAVIASRHERE